MEENVIIAQNRLNCLLVGVVNRSFLKLYRNLNTMLNFTTMKVLFTGILLLLWQVVCAQVSYDFGVTLPPNGEQAQVVSNVYFGTYSNPDSPLKYEFSEEGIFILSININSISRKTIRESSQYEVRNNHIFGVSEDSIPCVLEGENYYFGIRHREQIAGQGSVNKLIRIAPNEYILNYEENGTYIPTLISFSAAGLSVRQFDYESETKAFRKIKERTSSVKAIEFITLYPTTEEWAKLKLEDIFGPPVVYVR